MSKSCFILRETRHGKLYYRTLSAMHYYASFLMLCKPFYLFTLFFVCFIPCPSFLSFILLLLNDTAGSLQEGERVLRECLERKKKVLGPRHPATITTMLKLASLLTLYIHTIEESILLSLPLPANVIPLQLSTSASVLTSSGVTAATLSSALDSVGISPSSSSTSLVNSTSSGAITPPSNPILLSAGDATAVIIKLAKEAEELCSHCHEVALVTGGELGAAAAAATTGKSFSTYFFFLPFFSFYLIDDRTCCCTGGPIELQDSRKAVEWISRKSKEATT